MKSITCFKGYIEIDDIQLVPISAKQNAVDVLKKALGQELLNGDGKVDVIAKRCANECYVYEELDGMSFTAHRKNSCKRPTK